ncbi:MAG TPA: hypothetical protein DEP72_03710 [Clostridiales bacterium]|nr:MAG: hypothetical protein A2Y18_05360 [Clostridiales bacterium GWD2_32_19]HCC07260.1 hypothetical protein [Clostridiales bacterium]
MFMHEKPIENVEDDILDRKNFSEHLGRSLLEWKENESLVLALYGSWGSGKTSIINMAKEYIGNKKTENKPIIIDFNPWMFSESDKLVNHFFEEIAKGIELKSKADNDLKLAEKLREYSNMLNLVPKASNLTNEKSHLWVVILAFFGVTINQILSETTNIDWIRILISFIFIFLILVELCAEYFEKISNIIFEKYSYKTKTALEIKNEIIENLKERNKKIIIVIDDIDRLNKTEQRQIFRLIRANADFPNTIYLLAFDKNIIEKNLIGEGSELEEKFLEKIIQVNFDIPHCNTKKVQSFLFKELDRVIGVLPTNITRYFDNSDTHWANVYHSGFKNFFKNIRDVKRYISGLEFNITQLINNTVLEVNPIDFIAIEAIRNFTPDFYCFMKDRNLLFTETESSYVGDYSGTREKKRETRRNEINQKFEKINLEYREDLKELIFALFPQVKGMCEGSGNTHYGNDFQKEWTKTLKICATKNFDAYFTLIPAGDYAEINQFEIEELLNSIRDKTLLKEKLREFIDIKKIDKLLDILQSYTDDKNKIKTSDIGNLIVVLFDLFEELPEQKPGMLEFENDITIARIVFQLLKREDDEEYKYRTLENVIKETINNYMPIYYISLEERKNKKDNSDNESLSEESFTKLKKICVEKLNQNKKKLVLEKEIIRLMYVLKDWKQEELLEYIVSEIQREDETLIGFIFKTISTSTINTIGEYGVRTRKRIGYKTISNYMKIEEIKSRVENMKNNVDLYENYTYIIDMFLDGYQAKDNNDF